MLAPDRPSMLLQQPGRMGPLRLKNRVVMGPMGTNFGTTDGFSTERDKIYLRRAGARWCRDDHHRGNGGLRQCAQSSLLALHLR